MKLHQIILEDHSTLSKEYIEVILKELFRRQNDDIEIQLEALSRDGFVIVDILPFQFAEQKVAELQNIAQIDRVSLQCYLEEYES